MVFFFFFRFIYLIFSRGFCVWIRVQQKFCGSRNTSELRHDNWKSAHDRHTTQPVEWEPAHIKFYFLFSFFGRFFLRTLGTRTLKLLMFWCANVTRVDSPARRYLAILFVFFFSFQFFSFILVILWLSCSPLVLDTFISFYCFSIRLGVHVLSLAHTLTHTRIHGNCIDDRRALRHRTYVLFGHGCPPYCLQFAHRKIDLSHTTETRKENGKHFREVYFFFLLATENMSDKMITSDLASHRRRRPRTHLMNWQTNEKLLSTTETILHFEVWFFFFPFFSFIWWDNPAHNRAFHKNKIWFLACACVFGVLLFFSHDRAHLTERSKICASLYVFCRLRRAISNGSNPMVGFYFSFFTRAVLFFPRFLSSAIPFHNFVITFFVNFVNFVFFFSFSFVTTLSRAEPRVKPRAEKNKDSNT